MQLKAVPSHRYIVHVHIVQAFERSMYMCMINSQTLEKDTAKTYNPRQQPFTKKIAASGGTCIYMYIVHTSSFIN